MASVRKPARSAAKSKRGVSLGAAFGALLSCGVVAGSVWGLASSLSAMHEASRTLSDGSLHLDIALGDGRRPERVPMAIKSARFLKPTADEIRESQLTDVAIQLAHKRSQAAQLALADKREKADRVMLVASAEPAKPAPKQIDAVETKPSIVTALVEDIPAPGTQPFDLVLAQPETEDEDAVALPSEIPLPEARPATEAAIPEQKPAEDKPPLRKKPDLHDFAYAKPQRSLFGDLFNRKPNGDAWQGNDRKVAIYDVSNATVYLPDGTRLRAHSGIGNMRDNPRYDHVSMRGPTPAGIYRLSMREKRFYGVEAIRMTSIDGRDPKNRTGLLTHTNLLRGQIGSHGCVAFQNYQPFLNAFKRGQVSTLVVVPELPSSTQLAALYRKAGA